MWSLFFGKRHIKKERACEFGSAYFQGWVPILGLGVQLYAGDTWQLVPAVEGSDVKYGSVSNFSLHKNLLIKLVGSWAAASFVM